MRTAAAHQHRCGQTAHQSSLRHDFRVLRHGAGNHHQHQSHHHDECHARTNQRMQFRGRQRGQIHHAQAEALQGEAVFAFFTLQLHACARRRHACAEHGQIAHTQRQMAAHITQQERQPEKQHQRAGFQQRVAAQKPCQQRIRLGRFAMLRSDFA